MMTKTNEAPVTTLAALQERHLEALHKFGLTERAIELLSIILVDFVKNTEVAPAVFRRDHRSDAERIQWLEEKRFITSQGTPQYEPQFTAFCAILAAKKRVASSLYNEMKRVIRRALEMLDKDPLRTYVPFEEFALKLPISVTTIPALKLLGSASLGIHLSSSQDVQMVQFSEGALKGQKFLGYVSSYLDTITRTLPGAFVLSQSSGNPPGKPKAPEVEFS